MHGRTVTRAYVALRRAGITQAAMAQELGIHTSRMCALLKGNVPWRAEEQRQYAIALGVPEEMVFGPVGSTGDSVEAWLARVVAFLKSPAGTHCLRLVLSGLGTAGLGPTSTQSPPFPRDPAAAGVASLLEPSGQSSPAVTQSTPASLEVV